jgi:Uma2 family endonuclease
MHTSAPIERRPFNVDEYHRMGEAGILPEAGVELLGGEVIVKNGRGTPHRWTYDEYVEMVRAGILSEDERTELIDGEIVCMTPVGHRHIYVVDQLNTLLGDWMRGRAIVRVQSPLRFNSMEAPHPDVAVLRLTDDRYRSRQAGPWDALLVVEVSDSSVTRDQELKGPMYARAAIPEFWLVDVNRPAVFVHLTPVAGEYTDIRRYGPGEAWTSPGLDGREVRVDEALGLPLPPR